MNVTLAKREKERRNLRERELRKDTAKRELEDTSTMVWNSI